ncbi:MAG: methyltransferase domain-containing protein [Magnetococcus sp. DMHC-6]
MNKPNFFNLLCCPNCRDDLLLEKPANNLRCLSCQQVYPIIDGIPVLFPIKNDENQVGNTIQRYWDPVEKADLYDRKVEGDGTIFGTYNHESEIRGLTTLYRTENLDLILDAGCGNGRFMETFPKESIAVGVDASLNLLRIARARQRGHFHVCCELEHLPFKSNVFGSVVSCRVLQHIHAQQAAIQELGRVVRENGDVLLQIYNSWNPKNLYKAIRMSRIRKVFNFPFRLLFKSMSPFDDWGISYDRYNSWWELKNWMRQSGLSQLQGRGVGFGYHKYLFQPFYIDAILSKKLPELLKAYYNRCLEWENRLGHRLFFRHSMEKIALRGTKNSAIVERSFVEKIIKNLDYYLHSSLFFNHAARQECKRERNRSAWIEQENHWHIVKAVEWLKNAQDVPPDAGVARGYSLGWNFSFNGQGWQPSYPETTGYIIPTFFDCAAYLQDPDLKKRALQMADWEIQVQLANGAVMGGTIVHQQTLNRRHVPSPAVFNTGQVIFGWLRAFQETGKIEYLQACNRAGAFLLKNQHPDGHWNQGNSQFADPKATTYNARVGWALMLLGKVSKNNLFIQSGERNMRYTLDQQTENGWFINNCLSDPNAPLLHTICYTLEGLLGAAMLLANNDYLQAVRKTADRLLELVDDQGLLPGRLDAQWQGTVSWSCLTGNAQLAGIFLNLAQLTHEPSYRQGARKLLSFLKKNQNCQSENPGLRGGIKGSYPFDGAYGRYELLNWATKFFIDALLLDEKERI